MRFRTALPSIFALLVPALLAMSATAQPLKPAEVPDSLKGWVPWVLHAKPNHLCTTAGGVAICRWPGPLALTVHDKGARFEQRFFLDRDGEVQLPGSATLWPQGVRVNGELVVVLHEGKQPVVQLQAGEHVVTGELSWGTAPELLPVPNQTAIVQLQIKGERVRNPRREEGGDVWLGAREVKTKGEGLEIEVHRLIADAIPMQVTTRLVLHVSGRARELNFEDVLLSGTVPIAVASQLPVRLDKQRRLSVQVHAGTYEVYVITKAGGDLEALAAPKLPPPWPSLETWVWSADESLRQVELSGAPNVDTSRASLPAGWRDLPAYSVTPGQSLTFKTSRRAKAEAEPNVVQLNRELWLDVDGTGYSVRDRITGKLRRSHRLFMKEGTLGHVKLGNEGQLINDLRSESVAQGGPVPRGVEIRSAELNVTAESRLDDARLSFPAVGWSENIERLTAHLRLPPGWDVLAISGADDTSQTWVSRWDVFAVFFVALIAIAALRLLGAMWGLIALLALTLTYHQAGAPLFIWVVLLALLALRGVVTSPRWSRGLTTLWWGAGVALVLIAVPFCVAQLRIGLFPHVGDASSGWNATPWVAGWAVLVVAVAVYRTAEAQTVRWPAVLGLCAVAGLLGLLMAQMFGGFAMRSAKRSDMNAKMQSPMAPQEELASDAVDGLTADDKSALPRSVARKRRAGSPQAVKAPMTQQQDPNAVVQTGEGIPAWESGSWMLDWSGPVPADHHVKLWLISPRANLVASIVRVLLLVLFAFGVLRRWRRALVPPMPASAAATSIGIAVLAGTLLLDPSSAVAQQAVPEGTPAQAVLDELAKRLTAPPACAPNCVSVARASIDASSSRIVFDAEVHVGATTAFRMPGPASAWLPNVITVDGKQRSAIALASDGFALLRLEKGVHRVRLEGFAPPGESLTLAFGDHPKHLVVNAKGWEVDGLRDNGRADASIQLRRTLVSQDNATDQPEAVRLQPWFEVQRTIGIGVRWTVNTTVRRISPSSVVDVVRVPLLTGEDVTKAGAIVENGHIVITVPRGETQVTWTSSLEPSADLSLVAPQNVRWSEVWELTCGPIYRCQHAGLPPITHFQGDLWQPLFRPWPGEKLQLTFDRPPAAQGSVLTIDSLTLETHPGLRRTQSKLTATVRSSSGGVHGWTLPEGAELQSVTIDGTPRSLQMQDNALRTTLRPGVQQVEIAFQQEGGLKTWFKTPQIGLGAPVVNARVRVNVPDDRWLLWTRGPAWGAVVLFWPYLLLALLVAWLLSRVAQSPLRMWDWLLLSLGFVTLPVWVAVPVVAWFFALQHRSQPSDLNRRAFNVRQVLLAGLSIVALLCFYAAVHNGLLVHPDMQVAGAGSHGGNLEWYIDRSSNDLPQAVVLSLSIWVWRLFMLAWSLWLAFRLVGWVRWAWSAFSTGGRWKAQPASPAPEG